MQRFTIAIVVYLLAIMPAAAVTVDFSDPSIPSAGLEEGFTTEGYSFTFSPVPIPQEPAYFVGGPSPGLAFCPDCILNLERSDGESFSLYSFLARDAFSGVSTLQVTGYYEAGGSVTDNFNLTTVAQTYTGNWDGLSRVEFSNLDSSPTGIVSMALTTVVPIPAAVWLFGSALAGLGWIRRKQSR